MSPARGRLLIAAAVALGIGLRLWDGLGSSLWLDELHSIVHAWAPADVAGVCEHTHWDFHAPLFFLALHFVRPATPEVARLIPVLSSLLILAPLLWFARRSRLGPSAPVLAAALFAFLPFQIQCATELRPYAWLALASAAACWAAFADSGSAKVRFAIFALAVGFGLNTHYFMAAVVLLIGAVRVLFALPLLGRARASGEPAPLALGWLVLAGAAGACAFLPWLFKYMFWAVDKPSTLVPPDIHERTITEANRDDILQAPLRTLVPLIRSLGGTWATLAIAGTVLLAAGIVACGAAWVGRALRREGPAASRPVAMAITFATLALLLVPFLSFWSWARVSVRYLWIAAWLWPLVICELLAALRSPRLRAALGAMIVVGTMLAGLGHAGGKTREDVREAVRKSRLVGIGLAAADPARPPVYTALLSQPKRFEHDIAYFAYANDLEQVELKLPAHQGPKPRLLPQPGESGFERPVVVITRRWLDLDSQAALDKAVREGMPEIPRLRTGRRVLDKVPIDDTMTVWVFAPEAQ